MNWVDECDCKFDTLNGRSKVQFFSDLRQHFFHRTLKCCPVSYIGFDTRRVFSLVGWVQKGDLKIRMNDPELIRNFTDRFDQWYQENPTPTQQEYDSFHEIEVEYYYQTLRNLGVFKRKGVQRQSDVAELSEYYNTFAKPYNLLIWHHCFGKKNGRIEPYPIAENSELFSVLHPAFDSRIFKSMRTILQDLVGVPSTVRIPKGNKGFTYLRSRDEYTDLLAFYRTEFAKFGQPALVLESFFE